ncbi:hypothetical protein ASPZODRAFT_1278165 [Penicilliopsis zonata CBS 506.65]|uniref:Uncharacterized protein n=1 Tax=Penicilliopsis zonata CBS 506.65 TaxID=1073090 RepID=A0A1L9S6Q3_9EURO|nr:hypothetical protein ASPZODRAFT_1278165 [Penicilliopsis zonata CBS 506.65]OJJ42857.1 hypothetical protein ASPZODRAFT_1278165 [Penicilliopsis zonata CBS 506.65]
MIFSSPNHFFFGPFEASTPRDMANESENRRVSTVGSTSGVLHQRAPLYQIFVVNLVMVALFGCVGKASAVRGWGLGSQLISGPYHQNGIIMKKFATKKKQRTHLNPKRERTQRSLARDGREDSNTRWEERLKQREQGLGLAKGRARIRELHG